MTTELENRADLEAETARMSPEALDGVDRNKAVKLRNIMIDESKGYWAPSIKNCERILSALNAERDALKEGE